VTADWDVDRDFGALCTAASQELPRKAFDPPRERPRAEAQLGALLAGIALLEREAAPIILDFEPK
jgi:hypothetical protein